MAKATKTAPAAAAPAPAPVAPAPAPAPAPVAEAAAEGTSKSIIDRSKYVYPTLRVRGADGKPHYIRGKDDAVNRAIALHVIVNGRDIMEIPAANNVEMKEHSNMGQVRMAIGNILRARIKRGEPVIIGEYQISALDDVIELPVEEAPAEAAETSPAEAAPAATAPTPPRTVPRQAPPPPPPAAQTAAPPPPPPAKPAATKRKTAGAAKAAEPAAA